MPDKSVDAVITDPPYNVGKDYGTHNDSMPDKEYILWSEKITTEALRISSVQFWVAPRYKLELWIRLLPKSHLIVIPRGAAGPFRGGWSDNFEIALAIGKPIKGAPSDLWRGIRLKGEGYYFKEETYGHPGYTPIPIMRRAIEYLTENNGIIFDPFMGTGTTGVACVQTGRNFIGCEIDHNYYAIAEKRIKEAQQQIRMDI
jgi:site-specific DNA-methyltransferase (adenine-specific)